MLSRSRRVSIAAQTGVRLKWAMCGLSSPALGLGLGSGSGLRLGAGLGLAAGLASGLGPALGLRDGIRVRVKVRVRVRVGVSSPTGKARAHPECACFLS